MDIEELLKDTIIELLDKLDMEYSEIEITEEEGNSYFINIKSTNPSYIIGHHGSTVHALQHLLKVLSWKRAQNNSFNIMLDVDDYRKRQEEKAIQSTQRKVESVRKNGRPQHLPPMSPYLRRKVHMYCMGAGFDDIETISDGEGERRHIIIKLK